MNLKDEDDDVALLPSQEERLIMAKYWLEIPTHPEGWEEIWETGGEMLERIEWSIHKLNRELSRWSLSDKLNIYNSLLSISDIERVKAALERVEIGKKKLDGNLTRAPVRLWIAPIINRII